MPNCDNGGPRATLTIRPSPFPEDTGRVWDFAGLDAFGGLSYLNAAWGCLGELFVGVEGGAVR